MELYQIGRFLDLDILAQNCEDAIVQVSWRISTGTVLTSTY
jgi:hypothetical protein